MGGGVRAYVADAATGSTFRIGGAVEGAFMAEAVEGAFVAEVAGVAGVVVAATIATGG